jgi:hypothetical protein
MDHRSKNPAIDGEEFDGDGNAAAPAAAAAHHSAFIRVSSRWCRRTF